MHSSDTRNRDVTVNGNIGTCPFIMKEIKPPTEFSRGFCNINKQVLSECVYEGISRCIRFPLRKMRIIRLIGVSGFHESGPVICHIM